MSYSINTGNAIKTVLSLAAIFGLCSTIKGCYNSNDNDALVRNEFSRQVKADRTPRLLTIKIDGVTLEGNLDAGAVLQTDKDGKPTASAFDHCRVACRQMLVRAFSRNGGTPTSPFVEKGLWQRCDRNRIP